MGGGGGHAKLRQHQQVSGRDTGGPGEAMWLDRRGHGNEAEEVVSPDHAQASQAMSESSRNARSVLSKQNLLDDWSWCSEGGTEAAFRGRTWGRRDPWPGGGGTLGPWGQGEEGPRGQGEEGPRGKEEEGTPGPGGGGTPGWEEVAAVAGNRACGRGSEGGGHPKIDRNQNLQNLPLD